MDNKGGERRESWLSGARRRERVDSAERRDPVYRYRLERILVSSEREGEIKRERGRIYIEKELNHHSRRL